MKKFILTTSLFIFHLSILHLGFAQQPFQKSIYSPQYELGNAIDVYSGGHIIAGIASDPLFYFGAYLLKTDNDGNHVWDKLFRYSNSMSGDCVKATSDGGFVMVGSVDDWSGEDTTFMMKVDASGNILWSKLFYYGQGEECYPTSVMETADGGYVVTGIYLNLVSFSNNQPFMFKTDAGGNLLWAKMYSDGNGSYIYANDVIEDASGNLWVIGKNHFFSEGQFLMKTNDTGTIQWMRVYKAPNLVYIFPIDISKRLDNTVDLVFAQIFSSSQNHLIVLHVDSNGILLDDHSYTAVNYDGQFIQAAKSSDTELVTVGSFIPSGAFDGDAVMAKINIVTGAAVWANSYGSGGYDGGNDVEIDANGNCVMTGFTQADSLVSFVGGAPTDIYYLKTNASGSIACNSLPVTVSAANFSILDSAYSLLETDITSTSYFSNFTPGVFSFYQDTTACLGVETNDMVAANSMANVFPNPSNGKFKILFNAEKNTKARFEVANVIGEKIVEENVTINSGENLIDVKLNSVEPGIYFTKIIFQEKSIAVKIIIN